IKGFGCSGTAGFVPYGWKVEDFYEKAWRRTAKEMSLSQRGMGMTTPPVRSIYCEPARSLGEGGCQVRLDGEDGVSAGELEHVEQLLARRDQAELAANGLHTAVQQHDQAEAGAVGIFDPGEFEDQLAGAVVGQFVDGGFSLMQRHAKRHFAGEFDDDGGGVDALNFRSQVHAYRPSFCDVLPKARVLLQRQRTGARRRVCSYV